VLYKRHKLLLQTYKINKFNIAYLFKKCQFRKKTKKEANFIRNIQQANQILVIEDGNIVERGKHNELIASKGRRY
jgi:ABC-type transport system involved in Fe-S cluster assembly fused permease/ATPase subunit